MKYIQWTSILVVLLVSFSLGWRAEQPPVAKAGSQLPLTPEGIQSFICTPTRVAVFENRMHIGCSAAAPSTAFIYFSFPIDSSTNWQANRFIALSNSAIALNKNVWIWYSDVATDNPVGCAANDCRKLVALELLK